MKVSRQAVSPPLHVFSVPSVQVGMWAGLEVIVKGLWDVNGDGQLPGSVSLLFPQEVMKR